MEPSEVCPGWTVKLGGVKVHCPTVERPRQQVWDFNPSVSPASATVGAGGSANFNVNVSPVNGFNGTVNLACSSSSGLISCSFNPSPLTVSASGTATSLLTVTASSQAASARKYSKAGASILGFLLIVLALPIGALLTDGRFRQKWFACLSLLLALCVILSCGGGASGGGGGGSGGGGGGGVGGGGGGSQSYSISIQVSSGNNTKSAGTITLTVN
jgi:hypothetical protein